MIKVKKIVAGNTVPHSLAGLPAYPTYYEPDLSRIMKNHLQPYGFLGPWPQDVWYIYQDNEQEFNEWGEVCP